MIDATYFLPDQIKLTESRFKQIAIYIIYCYQKMVSENKKYSYARRGKIPKEELLKNGLVNDYLQKSPNKDYFKRFISDSQSVEITFVTEESMIYADINPNEFRTDKIDITIHVNDLQSAWSNETDDQVKFAIECKRICVLSDANKYLIDTENFCNREFKHTRLPIEGQIAFIENASISNTMLQDDLNTLLVNHKIIKTKMMLTQEKLKDTFDGTYLSKHYRSFNDSEFAIYHIFLDYSCIISE